MDRERYNETSFGRARSTGGRNDYLAYFPNPIPRELDISGANLLRLAAVRLDVLDGESFRRIV